MRKNNLAQILFGIFGFASLAFSLLIGCSFSAESSSVRINSGNHGSGDEPYTRHPRT